MNTRLSCMKTLLLLCSTAAMTMGRRMHKSLFASLCLFVMFDFHLVNILSAIPHTFLSLLLHHHRLRVYCANIHCATGLWIYMYYVWVPLDYDVWSARHMNFRCVCEKKIVVHRRHNFCHRIVQHEFICRCRRYELAHTV